jgi:hypothetical protein
MSWRSSRWRSAKKFWWFESAARRVKRFKSGDLVDALGKVRMSVVSGVKHVRSTCTIVRYPVHMGLVKSCVTSLTTSTKSQRGYDKYGSDCA